MGDWTFTFFKVMLIPIISMVGGLFGIYIPPIEINSMFGYRSLMSKKSQETWDFAQQYWGKLFLLLGKYLLIFSLLTIIFIYKRDQKTVEIVGGSWIIFQIILMYCSFILTEIALKKNFDENGNRKQNNF